MLLVSSIYSMYIYGWLDNWWIRKDLKGSGSRLIAVLTQDLPGGAVKKPRKASASITRVPAKIRTEYLANYNLQRYLQTGLFGTKL
jgi:hypothetical protein